MPSSPKVEPRLLKGFRDYLPEDALPMRALGGIVVSVFERYGFLPMETPVLEYADLLTGKYGPEADKLMYRFVDHGEREVAMRYDHTVPLARGRHEPKPPDAVQALRGRSGLACRQATERSAARVLPVRHRHRWLRRSAS
ncbi:MAG: ATP phosphoribosyltransferase regulatory subunit [Candidatus Andersenbacteria bacterium]